VKALLAGAAAALAFVVWLFFGANAFAATDHGRGVARGALAVALFAVAALLVGLRALRSRCELEDAERVLAEERVVSPLYASRSCDSRSPQWRAPSTAKQPNASPGPDAASEPDR